MLQLVAYDGGDPPLTGSLNVTVHVVDTNDNPPVFEYEEYEVGVAEDLPVGSTVIQVQPRGYSTLTFVYGQYTLFYRPHKLAIQTTIHVHSCGSRWTIGFRMSPLGHIRNANSNIKRDIIYSILLPGL